MSRRDFRDLRDDEELRMQVRELMGYARACWPSGVKPEWRVEEEDYLRILPEVVADWMEGASMGRKLVRIAGPSGSGKTSQLLPAVEAWYGEEKPILAAARKLVQYHPFVEEIRAEYGEENLRKRTDEFVSVMLFLVLRELIYGGYDIILDVAFLDKKVEGYLLGWLRDCDYDVWMTMVAVSPKISARWLGKRAWRHDKSTEEEFWRAMEEALRFYVEEWPDVRMVVWSAWDLKPVYDGGIKGAIEVWREYLKIDGGEESDEGRLREAKISYLRR